MNSLENARVGDKLIVSGISNQFILTVEKVQGCFVIARTFKFRKSDGVLVNANGWSTTIAKIATEEDLEAFSKAAKLKEMVRQCRDIRFERLSDFQLEQILEIANKKS